MIKKNPSMQKETRKTIFTIGHSNRTRDQFLELLLDNEIDLLADVRRYPASRRYPHFNKDQLNESTGQAGIEYLHLPALGGRRGRAEPDSPNNFWRVESFQAYADYMGTDQAQQAIKELSAMSDGHRMAITCS